MPFRVRSIQILLQRRIPVDTHLATASIQPLVLQHLDNHFHSCHPHRQLPHLPTISMFSLSIRHLLNVRLFSSAPASFPSTSEHPSPIVVPETRPPKSRAKGKANSEKKKPPATPKPTKKKAAKATTTTPVDNDETPPSSEVPSFTETASKAAPKTPEPAPPSPLQDAKRRISGTESEDLDEQNDEQQGQATNGKSDHESDGSGGNADRSSSTAQSSSASPEKRGGRTTIKPQQLDVGWSSEWILFGHLIFPCRFYAKHSSPVRNRTRLSVNN